MSGLRVRHDHDVIVVVGEIDMSNAPVLWATLAAEGDPGDRVRIDLTDVPFMDSAALSVLLRATKQRRVEVVGCSQVVRRLIEVAGVEHMFDLRVG